MSHAVRGTTAALARELVGPIALLQWQDRRLLRWLWQQLLHVGHSELIILHAGGKCAGCFSCNELEWIIRRGGYLHSCERVENLELRMCKWCWWRGRLHDQVGSLARWWSWKWWHSRESRLHICGRLLLLLLVLPAIVYYSGHLLAAGLSGRCRSYAGGRRWKEVR